MSKEDQSSLTHRDVSRLRQTATDAVNDMDYTASSLGSAEGESRLKELAKNFQRESGQQLEGALSVSRDFISMRPIFCVSAALALGVLIGLSQQSRYQK